MNAMCGMSKFIIGIPVSNESSTTLVECFLKKCVMKFGLCHLVILDDGTLFKYDFVAM